MKVKNTDLQKNQVSAFWVGNEIWKLLMILFDETRYLNLNLKYYCLDVAQFLLGDFRSGLKNLIDFIQEYHDLILCNLWYYKILIEANDVFKSSKQSHDLFDFHDFLIEFNNLPVNLNQVENQTFIILEKSFKDIILTSDR